MIDGFIPHLRNLLWNQRLNLRLPLYFSTRWVRQNFVSNDWWKCMSRQYWYAQTQMARRIVFCLLAVSGRLRPIARRKGKCHILQRKIPSWHVSGSDGCFVLALCKRGWRIQSCDALVIDLECVRLLHACVILRAVLWISVSFLLVPSVMGTYSVPCLMLYCWVRRSTSMRSDRHRDKVNKS